MARFLFTVWPYPGHIHPNVAVAHALAERGHEPAFYTAGSIAPLVQREGFRCFPFVRLDGARVDDLVLGLDALSMNWSKARQRMGLLREWLLGTVEAQIADLADVRSAFCPDVIVCDPAMWGPLLVVQEEARVPLAIVSYVAACMLPGLDGPIMGVPLPRPRGALGRLGRRVLRSLEKMVAARVRRGAEEVRARHGLSPMRTSVTEFAGRMPLYLVPSTPAFDRSRRDLPASVRYIGACLWDKPDGTPPAPWLAELPSDQRVVYVTEGTMHSKRPLVLAAALQGLASLPVRVIATTGVHRDPEKLGLGPIPANARVERWVPHSDVLPRADVVVTTGGTGTVLAALCAGLPLVVVPTAWDQPENAWRVAETGAGIRVPPRSCTPERIRDSVARVLADESFRRNARRLRADLAAHGGAAEAADLLVALVPGREGRARRDAPALTAELVRLRGAQAPRPALESTPPPEAVTPNGHAPAAPPRPGPQGGGH